mmetsp:Transcript_12846/g.36958  ORF Transcript_12846/g.36958 Transcript_12846/m.36958 type:complete len:367 (-) Transcript_12846:8-1108(-)
MACDQQVQAIVIVQALVPAPVVAAREMRDGDLPTGRGLTHLLLHPLLLPLVRPPEPTLAIPDVLGAVIAGALRARRVVLLRAHVVLGLLPRLLGVEDVRIDDEVLGDVAVVLHLPRVVARGHDPIVVEEGKPDLLRPALVHAPAAVVVVAKDAEPRNLGQRAVHLLPVRGEGPIDRALVVAGRRVARVLEAFDIKVVADVEHVLGLGPRGAILENARDGVLSLRVPTVAREGYVIRQCGAPVSDHEDARGAVLVVLDLYPTGIVDAVVLIRPVGHREVTLVHLKWLPELLHRRLCAPLLVQRGHGGAGRPASKQAGGAGGETAPCRSRAGRGNILLHLQEAVGVLACGHGANDGRPPKGCCGRPYC